MKNIIPTMLLGIAILSSCTNETKDKKEITESSYLIEENTALEWKGIKSENYFHTGTLNINSGELTVVEDSITGGRFEIDMLSIKTTSLEGEKALSLENHLMGLDSNEYHKPNDFFHAVVYPIVIVNVQDYDGTNLNVELEMMGKTINKTVPVNVDFGKEEVHINGGFGVDFDELEIPGLLPNPDTGEQKTIELKLNLRMKKKSE